MAAQVLGVVAVVFAGLAAGIFYAFSTGIMRGLDRASDGTYVEGMRDINRAVLNPLFLGAIFAPTLAFGSAIPAVVAEGSPLAAWLTVGATAASVAAVFVTISGNVPLNEALERSRDEDAAARDAFHRRWLGLNHVRTALTVGALVLGAVALAA
ncbi:anthrone oxygenase family protein [Homoserinibacter sp. YIM 151385]|uniref:anthrone oxygenase family protein n=1 Tax=Homoserinibacter sp. YIM 151385 TaxID=2985506 RepID=UPI0022F009C0|nr:anthrone oxygenase family protein [Homoserinibacter sp. YIM 151385]WBU37402.1 DUF1772 domain-containing protein [Homoserinibacter sp. YIM 151385]